MARVTLPDGLGHLNAMWGLKRLFEFRVLRL